MLLRWLRRFRELLFLLILSRSPHNGTLVSFVNVEVFSLVSGVRWFIRTVRMPLAASLSTKRAGKTTFSKCHSMMRNRFIIIERAKDLWDAECCRLYQVVTAVGLEGALHRVVTELTTPRFEHSLSEQCRVSGQIRNSSDSSSSPPPPRSRCFSSRFTLGSGLA